MITKSFHSTEVPVPSVRLSKNTPGFEAVAHLRKECDRLKHELHRAQKGLEKLRQREKELVGR